MDKMVELHG